MQQRLLCVYAGQLPERLLRRRDVPGRYLELGVWQQRGGLCELPDGHPVSERLLCGGVWSWDLHRLLRRHDLPGRYLQHRVRQQRGGLCDLPGGHRLPERHVRVRCSGLLLRLLPERRLPAG